MKNYVLKLMGIPILIMFMNLGFILLMQEVFTQIQTLIPILLLNAFISIDIVIRPISGKKDEYRRSILVVSFISMPIVFLLPYCEYKGLWVHYFSPFLSNWMIVIGIIVLVFGGILLVLSRLQLGEYGGPRIVIEDKHQLITTGVYQYIRHPMYLGFLLLFFGYSFALGSIVIAIVISLVFFLIFKNRMELEEKILITKFGEEYLEYKERTKKILPFLY